MLTPRPCIGGATALVGVLEHLVPGITGGCWFSLSQGEGARRSVAGESVRESGNTGAFLGAIGDREDIGEEGNGSSEMKRHINNHTSF